ncbi:hypothetical protein [Gordonia neofelifaecis]|uniref:Uncharacterized protein n=1 Tax=Gordonia neofelifaecis NRRL B-59395 TaxID=644548 RepID=F1YPT0_9ACTN|nr:hypothetical protein [Gordonia neofelifaecis]EGD53300.1 hypothetical protein SCNU_19707 [Gordonia neofelifaecis NRRL B-59395]
MLIRRTPSDAQVSATAHGLLASAVSLLLGIAAHSIGGGHVPSTTQLVVLSGLALCVGLVRARQVRSVEASRVRGRVRISPSGSLAALTVGQAGAHVSLSLMSGHAGHGTSVAPGPAMLLWHLLAVPAAAAVLFAAERLSRAIGGGVARAWRLVSTPVLVAEPFVALCGDRHVTALRPRPMAASAGVRGPPSQV